jgi:hypothetical protein
MAPYKTCRRTLRMSASRGGPELISAKLDAHIEDATFLVGPKGAVRVRIVRPKDS